MLSLVMKVGVAIRKTYRIKCDKYICKSVQVHQTGLREWLREGLHIADAWIVLFNHDNSHLFFHHIPHAARKMPRFFAPTPMTHDIPSENMQEL